MEALNDSKLIAMCIYNVALLSCLGAAINFVLDGDVNSSYGFVSGIIITGTLITSTIVFVPKVGECPLYTLFS
jgi:gamma-aminobutyric acid type B receptor